MDLEINRIYNMDCLDGLRLLPPESVDMFLVDPPYGETCNTWDAVVEPSVLWPLIMRALKSHGVIVMFGRGLFTAQMILANHKFYRYNLVWAKTQPAGFLNANRRPLAAHEDIMVFYKHLPTYNPQKTSGHPRKVSSAEHKRNTSHGTNYGVYGNTGYDSTERYPTTILRFPSDKQHDYYHPTQKPLDLCKYLIRTYTNPGDLVVDFCCGSGTTCVAAALEERKFIGMDNGICVNPKNPQTNGRAWAEIATDRLKKQMEFDEFLDTVSEPKDIAPADFNS